MIYHREYSNYAEYKHTQGYKALEHKKHVVGDNHRRTESFTRQFKWYKKYLKNGTVLCLGARTGCEVRGFANNGYNAVGIDLHPLSPLVLEADWHSIPFGNDSFQNVFTNSLDHCLDFEKLISEIKRVLVIKGVFVFQTHTKYAFNSRAEGDEVEDISALLEDDERHPSNAMFWDSVWEIPQEFIKKGFSLIHSIIVEDNTTMFLRRTK